MVEGAFPNDHDGDDNDDELWNQTVLYQSRSLGWLARSLSRNQVPFFRFSCIASSKPTLADWVSYHHFRIWTQRVSFETLDIWSQWCLVKKTERKFNFVISGQFRILAIFLVLF